LGNIFKVAGGTRDLRFIYGRADGTTAFGIVSYFTGGSGAAVPEPGTLSLFAAVAPYVRWPRRRGRQPGLVA
jgi:hypothetical protein